MDAGEFEAMSERFVIAVVSAQELDRYLNGLACWRAVPPTDAEGNRLYHVQSEAKRFFVRPLGARLVGVYSEPDADEHRIPRRIERYRVIWGVPIRRPNNPIEPPPPEPSKGSGFWTLLLFTAAGAFFVIALLDSLSRPWNYYAVYILLALSVVMWCWMVSRRGGSNAQHQSRPQRP